MKEKSGNGAAGVFAFAVIVFLATAVFVLYSNSEGSGDDKNRIWDYGHGEWTHTQATQEQIDRFYERVIAKRPDKRQGCQKYKKSIMRMSEGYEYASDEEWNKVYKRIIAKEVKAWKAEHGK